MYLILSRVTDDVTLRKTASTDQLCSYGEILWYKQELLLDIIDIFASYER